MIPLMAQNQLPLWKAVLVFGLIPIATAGGVIWAIGCAIADSYGKPYHDYPDTKPRGK